MAISIRCTKCTKDHKLGTKTCKHCGNNLSKNRKYKVSCKLKNGKWRSKTVLTLDLAYKIEAKFKTQMVEQEVFNLKKSPLMQEAWDKYLKWAKSNKASWKDDYIRWTQHVAGHLDNRPMNKISPLHVQEVLDSMRLKTTPAGKPYKPATVKQVLVLIKRVYNWCIQQELYFGQNPTDKVKPPKFDNRVTNPLRKKDLSEFLEVLEQNSNQYIVAVIKFALYSGRRRGEILALRWTDIDFENRVITFNGANTKNSKTQIVPMNFKCLELLKDCGEKAVSEYVFPNRFGMQYTQSGFGASWKRLKKKGDIKIRFHDLRHTFASYLASSGEVDIYTLKELLGHRELKMTERYAHLINGALRRGAEVADRVF